jgi:hypothetical protein
MYIQTATHLSALRREFLMPETESVRGWAMTPLCHGDFFLGLVTFLQQQFDGLGELRLVCVLS